MKHDHACIHQIIMSVIIAAGNPGALHCLTELAQRDDKDALVAIILATRFVGSPLHLLWHNCFERDSEKVASALRGLSYNRLCEIRDMLKAPPLGIHEARLALGVDTL